MDVESWTKNIGREFLTAIKGSHVVCLDISFGKTASFVLKRGYTKCDFIDLLGKMFYYSYKDVAEGNTLSGYIWCEDGSWFEREYSTCGNEGQYRIYAWVKHKCPNIPESLL